jgi:hypothetical protein
MKRIYLFLLLLSCVSEPLLSQTSGVNVLKQKTIGIKVDSAKRFRSLLPDNFATCQYGFFCKQELKLEKEIKLPIKFRLGSIEYTNWLEGKSRHKPNN